RRQGSRLDVIVDGPFRFEGPACLTIRDELQRPEQPSAADVADMRVLAKARAQPGGEPFASRSDPRQEVVIADDGLDSQGGRAGNRMRLIGVAMPEGARAGR